MTAPELREELRVVLGVPQSYEGLDDAAVDRLMDEAFQVLACQVLPFRMMTSVSVTLVGGTDTYVVSGQPSRIIACNLAGVFLQPYSLTRLEREAPGWASATGTPTRYWLEGVDNTTGSPKIRLYPNPTAGATLTVSVLSKPSVLSSWGNAEVAQWDALSQAAAVLFAAWRFGLRANVVADPEKQRGFLEGFNMYRDMLRSYEDPTSAQAQQSMVEKSWRTPS